MFKSKTKKFKNLFLELIAWLYAVLITFLSMSVGLIFEKNKEFISYLYRDYLMKKPNNFWVEYFVLALYLPKIFIWDRFLSKNRRGGLAVRMIYKYFGCTLPLEKDIKSIDLGQIVEMPSEGYTLAELDYYSGNTTVLELAYISRVVKSIKPKLCLEIGTCNGRSTLHIALNSPDDAGIYTIDLENEKREKDYQNIELLFDKNEYKYLRNKIVTLYGDTKKFDFNSLGKLFDFYIC